MDNYILEDIAIEAKAFWAKVVLIYKHWQFSGKRQLAFLEDLYLLINDGIPANKAVEMMAQVTTGVTRDVALTLTDKIAQGQSLAAGMKEWFAPSVVEIVRVGESGGALAQTMKSAIDALSQQGVAMSVLIGKVSYPLMVILMACGIIIYLEGSVFEQFKLIKPVEQWPEAGTFLLTLASIIKYWWWIFILGVIGLVLLMKKIFSTLVGEVRSTLDNYFPFIIYRKLVAARLLETLGLLVANGVVFKSALKVMQYQANPYMAWHLRHMESLLSTGKTNIADVLDTGLIENQNLMRLRIMAEVKGFEHGLIRMGSTGTKEATETLKKIATIIGGLLLIVGVFLIISVVRGIFLTGMSMGS